MVTEPQSLTRSLPPTCMLTCCQISGGIVQSIGVAPTVNLNPKRTTPSMFEPIHGSAFDITGKCIDNPVGTFWSAVMLLEHIGEPEAAAQLMQAIESVTANKDFHTPDLGGDAKTEKVTGALIAHIRDNNN